MILIPAATAEPTVALGNPIATGRQHTQLWPPGKSSTPVFFQFSSFQFSRSVVSESLQPHGLQHARPPCPSTTPGVYPNSCPLSQWCHPTILSSVVLFSSCLQSFPTSGFFPMSQFFTSGGQSIGVSALASVLPMNTRLISFRIHWLDLLAVQGTLKSLLPTPQFKSISSLVLGFPYSPTLTSIHNYWKNHSLDQTDLCWQSNVSAF